MFDASTLGFDQSRLSLPQVSSYVRKPWIWNHIKFMMFALWYIVTKLCCILASYLLYLYKIPTSVLARLSAIKALSWHRASQQLQHH